MADSRPVDRELADSRPVDRLLADGRPMYREWPIVGPWTENWPIVGSGTEHRGRPGHGAKALARAFRKSQIEAGERTKSMKSVEPRELQAEMVSLPQLEVEVGQIHKWKWPSSKRSEGFVFEERDQTTKFLNQVKKMDDCIQPDSQNSALDPGGAPSRSAMFAFFLGNMNELSSSAVTQLYCDSMASFSRC
ncbi:hypothetical protein M8J75_014972 [Diaphorina citri]|nr:hypothetical protein M8J75_014972 [Diaphorina citri]